MDINNPDSSPDGHLVSSFSGKLPLPFRVFLLVGLGGLCWGTNLHGLHLAGIDTAQVLQIRADKTSSLPSPYSPRSTNVISNQPFASPSHLYPPVYRITALFMAWVACGWALFGFLTKGDVDRLDSAKWVPSLVLIVVLACCLMPFRGTLATPRSILAQSIHRCLVSPASQPIHFSDVITADILTSYAKVLGDLWISAVDLLPGGSLRVVGGGGAVSEFAVPLLLSLPYAIRLRQCVVEYVGSNGRSKRPLYNAVKYATAFPVIFLSAAQRLLSDDMNDVYESSWLGEDSLFKIWVVSVFVNSAYSFWWDVTNDWGFQILTPRFWSLRSTSSLKYTPLYHQRPRSADLQSVSSDDSSSSTEAPHRTHRSSRSSSSTGMNTSPDPSPAPLGLRSHLLLAPSMPLLYVLLILTNLMLRFTWSLKLSSHLHSIADLEEGIFAMEALELLRRWMWVFVRVEWEVVKKEQERERESYEFAMQRTFHATSSAPAESPSPPNVRPLTFRSGSLDLENKQAQD